MTCRNGVVNYSSIIVLSFVDKHKLIETADVGKHLIKLGARQDLRVNLQRQENNECVVIHYHEHAL